MMLEVALTVRRGAFALQVEFTAPSGITVLFGPSGVGKTTVLNAIAGLERPQTGRICVGQTVVFDAARGIDLPVHRRRLGLVFQDGRLFPHLTVRQNLLFGHWFSPNKVGSPPLDEIVALLGIAPLLDRRPGRLSGGERQRVAIGRALLMRPQALLMDEPLASLDATRKEEILPYLQRLRDRDSMTILYVTHSTEERDRLADRVVTVG
jgi:molybdate transport system ATP-binding protein